MLRVLTYCLLLATIGAPSSAQTSTAPIASKALGKNIFPVKSGLPGAAPITTDSAAAATDNGIQYHGGPIMNDANGVNAYYIWYGDWSNDQLAKSVLVNFITHLGGSPYFSINTTYYDYVLGPHGTKLVKDRVINAVHYMGSANDASYSQGKDLTEAGVYDAVANAITSGALPPADPDAVYMLMISEDVNQTYLGYGFCTDYCAWHDSSADLGFPFVNGVDIKFAAIGNVAVCPLACAQNQPSVRSMSGSPAADGMANVLAHELEEAVTDPDVTSWYDADFLENADKCAWTFGGKPHAGTPSDPIPPNMKFKGIPYLIQQNWVNAKGGYCAMKWDN